MSVLSGTTGAVWSGPPTGPTSNVSSRSLRRSAAPRALLACATVTSLVTLPSSTSTNTGRSGKPARRERKTRSKREGATPPSVSIGACQASSSSNGKPVRLLSSAMDALRSTLGSSSGPMVPSASRSFEVSFREMPKSLRRRSRRLSSVPFGEPGPSPTRPVRLSSLSVQPTGSANATPSVAQLRVAKSSCSSSKESSSCRMKVAAAVIEAG